MADIVVVGLGGVAGANCRYLLTLLTIRRFGNSFPYGTLLINVSGCFVLSMFVTLAGRQILSGSFYYWLVAVGFCGGYTTFSTYTYETLALLRSSHTAWPGLLNLLGSYGLGLAAAWLGSVL